MLANKLIKIQVLVPPAALSSFRTFCDPAVSKLKQLSSQDVKHLKEINEFQICVPGHEPAYLRYHNKSSDEIDLYTTVVPASMEGNGVAKLLAIAALQFARDENLPVRPSCWYVDGYLARHPVAGLTVLKVENK